MSALPADQCIRAAAPYTYWKYLMVASCSDTSITYFSDDILVTKNRIGILVVFFDLLVTFWFWCSILALKKFQETTRAEIDANEV